MIASIELQHTFLQLETFRFLRNVFSAYFFAISPDTDAFVWSWDCPAICMCFCMYIKAKPPQVVDLQRLCLCCLRRERELFSQKYSRFSLEINLLATFVY